MTDVATPFTSTRTKKSGRPYTPPRKAQFLVPPFHVPSAVILMAACKPGVLWILYAYYATPGHQVASGSRSLGDHGHR